MKRGELGDGKLLSARVWPQTLFSKGLSHAIRFRDRPQVVHQRLSLLGKTQFYKIQESWLIGELQFCAFAGKPKRYECGADFRRRTESSARDAQDELRASEELRNDGEIAVLLGPRFSSETKSDFLLNNDVNFVDLIRERKTMMQNRRRNVVRQISVEMDAASSGESSEIGFQDVAGNDREIREFFRKALEARQEQRIKLDRVDGRTSGSEMLGHFTVARSYFNPAVGLILRNR